MASPIVVTDRAKKRIEITDRAPRRISATELAQALGAQVIEGPRRKPASPIGLIAQAEKVGRMTGREAAAVPAQAEAKPGRMPKKPRAATTRKVVLVLERKVYRALEAVAAKQSTTPKRLLEAWVEEKTAEGQATR